MSKHLLRDQRVGKKLRKILNYTRKDHVRPNWNLHSLIDDLTKYLNLTPEQQFRVTAKIKRHIHEDKAGVYHRIFLYFRDGRSGRRMLKEFLKMKFLGHKELAAAPDEKIVTWSIGTHVFKQARPICSVCNKEASSYTTTYSKGIGTTVCSICKPMEKESDGNQS